MISVFGGEIHDPIGEQIEYSGLILEAYKAESHDCDGCYFNNNDCERVLLCNFDERIDSNDVKFKLIEGKVESQ